MALNLITNIGTELTLSSQWGDLSTLLDQVKTGIGNKIRVHSLTNWDSSTTKPAIAEGSLFDVGGSLYLADSDTALTDEAGLIDGTCHIKLVPAVDGLTVTPTLTNDSMPAWDETKHGWYDGADSFLPYEFTKASAVYSDKFEYEDREKTILTYSDGTSGGMVLNAENMVNRGAWYNYFSRVLKSVGDVCLCSGQVGLDTTTGFAVRTFNYAEKTDSTTIVIYYTYTTVNYTSSSSIAEVGTMTLEKDSTNTTKLSGEGFVSIGQRVTGVV